MSDANGIFRGWHRTNRPISQAVNPVALYPVLTDSQRLTLERLSSATDEELAVELLDQHWHPPSIGAPNVHRPKPGTPHRRAGANKDSWALVETRRLDVDWAVLGNPLWLDHWPDGADRNIVPTDELADAPPPDDPDWSRKIARSDNLFVRDGALIRSFIEIEDDDPRHPTEARNEDVAKLNRLLLRYVEAIRSTLEAHHESALTTAVDDVAARRASLGRDADLSKGLPLLPAPSVLELADPHDESDLGSDNAEDLDFTRRLSNPSIASIHAAIQTWATEIHNYPTSFAKLNENDFTSLLTVTLSLAFGVANREVFCNLGKSDLHIPVAAIRMLRGLPPGPPGENAFIAEAKVGSGATLADRAKTQLDRYIPTGTPHGCLVFYVTRDDMNTGRDLILEALRVRADYLGDGELDGSPLDLMRFQPTDGGPEILIGIAFVHVGGGIDPVGAGNSSAP